MKYLLGILVFLWCTAHTTFAQTELIDLSISAIPSDPRPGQQVQFEAISYSVDLTQTLIVWKYNNRTVHSSIGGTKISLTAPGAGETGTVTATISGGGFSPVTEGYILRPASIDLLWEAPDSYTPPFYKGKAHPSTNAIIRGYAVPTASAPRNLYYTWSRNDSVQQSVSGMGKNAYVFKNSELNTFERIKVAADGSFFSGTSTAAVIPRTPSLIAYEKIDGFINYAAGTTNRINTDNQGIIVRFEPYFFSIARNIASDLTFNIRLGEEEIAGGQNINEIRLARPENGGTFSMNVLISANTYTLQSVNRLFSMLFN